jgi:hypothetical protein
MFTSFRPFYGSFRTAGIVSTHVEKYIILQNKRSLPLSKIKQLFGLNFTRIVLIVFILLLTDVAIKKEENKLLAEPAQFRLATQELDSIRALQRQIKLSRGYNVVFLGDSVVYGSSIGPRQTIPFYLEQELRKKYPRQNIRVFNYGYKGYGISETFFMLNSLRGAGVDLVVFGLSSGWFNRKPVLEHANVLKLTPDVFQKPRVIKLGVALPDSDNDLQEQRLSGFLAEHWALYRNRSTIAAGILGKSLAEKIFESKLAVYDPAAYRNNRIYWEEVRIPWYEKDFQKHKISKLGWINLSPANPQLGFYQLLMDLVRAEGMTPLFYVTPVNYDLFASLNLIDHSNWNKSRSGLRVLSRSMATNYVDFSDAIPGRYFADSVHLLASGNKLLAGKIAAEISHRGLIK